MQAYFDAYGKLPRFEEENQAPCYGCQKYMEIRDSSFDPEDLPKRNFESNTAHNNQPDDSNDEVNDLKTRLSDLRAKFVSSTNLDEQKSLISSMNSVIKQMQQQ